LHLPSVPFSVSEDEDHDNHEHDDDALYLSDLGLSAPTAPRLTVDSLPICILGSATTSANDEGEAFDGSPPPTTGYPPGQPFFLRHLVILI
jgi:hypothetical protein